MSIVQAGFTSVTSVRFGHYLVVERFQLCRFSARRGALGTPLRFPILGLVPEESFGGFGSALDSRKTVLAFRFPVLFLGHLDQHVVSEIKGKERNVESREFCHGCHECHGKSVTTIAASQLRGLGLSKSSEVSQNSEPRSVAVYLRSVLSSVWLQRKDKCCLKCLQLRSRMLPEPYCKQQLSNENGLLRTGRNSRNSFLGTPTLRNPDRPYNGQPNPNKKLERV